jgi:hypothetical protein
VSAAPHPDANGADALAASLQELSERIEQLQGEVRRLGPVLPEADAAWVEDAAEPASYAWLSALEPPVRRRPAVPRLLLEILFLAAVAVAAALAELDAPAIAGVMAVAWVLVALIEWASSRADRRRAEIMLRPPPEPPQPLPADPSWYVPPVEQTMLEGSPPDASTGVTKLPPSPAPEVETTGERRAD